MEYYKGNFYFPSRSVFVSPPVAAGVPFRKVGCACHATLATRVLSALVFATHLLIRASKGRKQPKIRRNLGANLKLVLFFKN